MDKEQFLSIYNKLNYDNQQIVMNVFRTCAKDDFPKIKSYDVSGVIKSFQKQKNYTDQEVCDKVNSLLATNNDDKFLDIDTYRKIKYRNSQSSKSKTNWLTLIAQALEFNPSEYNKHLSSEFYKYLASRSAKLNSISTLYDLLSTNDQKAMHYLANSLLQHQFTP